jgi:hypothetical protein
MLRFQRPWLMCINSNTSKQTPPTTNVYSKQVRHLLTEEKNCLHLFFFLVISFFPLTSKQFLTCRHIATIPTDEQVHSKNDSCYMYVLFTQLFLWSLWVQQLYPDRLPACCKTPNLEGQGLQFWGVHTLEELLSPLLLSFFCLLWVNLSFTLLLWQVGKYSFSHHCGVAHYSYWALSLWQGQNSQED